MEKRLKNKHFADAMSQLQSSIDEWQTLVDDSISKNNTSSLQKPNSSDTSEQNKAWMKKTKMLLEQLNQQLRDF